MREIVSMLMMMSLAAALAWSGAPAQPPASPKGSQSGSASGSKGVVVSGKAAATAAGVQILEQGGNAADAGAATLLALAVTSVGAFCVGGEVPILVYTASNQSVRVLSGQGGAPRDHAAIEWYLKHGIPDGEVKAAAVPAAIDAIVTLLRMYGTKTFEEAVRPTLKILDAGGPTWFIDTGSRERIETGVHWQADLAVTFRKLVDAERSATGSREQRLQAVSDRFYRGDIADAIESWYREKGGFLRKSDLAAHKTRVEDPVHVNYEGYTVFKCGPWTQGPSMLEMLRLLEGFDLKKLGFESPDYIHVVTEAMKLAFADRDEYYGDPEFVQVPLQALLSDEYTQIRRPLIDMHKASLELRPGDPYQMRPVRPARRTAPAQGGTTNMCVTDRWGNVVTATPSGLSSTAGVAGKTGIIHGARLTSLNTWKGHPNVIAPGKRPRVTLTPTLVLKDGKPVMAIAVAGGDMQEQAAVQLILEYVDFGMTAEQAFHSPRFATNHFVSSFGQDKAQLGSLQVPSTLSATAQEQLRSRGHVLTTGRGSVGGVALLVLDPVSGNAVGVGSSAEHAR